MEINNSINKQSKEYYQENLLVIIYMGISAGVGVGISLILYYIFSFSDSSSLKLFLTVLLILLGFSGFIWYMIKTTITKSKQKIDYFSPAIFFPIIFVLFYGIGALELTDFEQPIPLDQYIYYFIGLLAYLSGLIVVRILWMRPVKIKNFILKNKWIPARIFKVISILIIISILSLIYFLLITRMPIFTGPNIEELRIKFVPIVSGFAQYLFRSIEIALILFFVHVFSRRKLIFRNPWRVGFVIFALLLLSSLAARRMVAMPLLTGIVIYNYMRYRINLIRVLTIGLVIFLLIVLMGYFRMIGSFQIEENLFLRQIYQEVNLRSANLYKITEVFPKQENFLGWNGFIQPFKAILPGTQKSIGNILKEDIMDLKFRGGGFMPSILGGFYLNFGLEGIITGMFLSGLILNFLYLNMLKRKDEFSIAIFSFVTVYFISTIPGMMLNEVWPVYAVFIIFITNMYCKKKRLGSKAKKILFQKNNLK